MKKNILLLLLFWGTSTQILLAQTFSWADSAIGTYGLGTVPTGYSICTDDSDNVFVTAGELAGFSLAKYNLNGLLEWTKSGYSSLSCGVATDHRGNCYTTGHFFLQKYNSNGTLLYIDSVSGVEAYYVSGNAISYDGDKYFYVTGSWQGGASITFGTQTISTPNNTGTELFVLKCDTAGNVIWAKSSVGKVFPSECNGLGINAASNGLIYVTGYFADSVTFGTDSVNTRLSQMMAFVACYDSSGNIQWAKSTGKYNSSGNSVSSDAAGNVYITGQDSSSDCFLAKYRSNGAPVWFEQCVGGVSGPFSWGFGVSTNSSGVSYITGGYQGDAFGSLYINPGAGDINIFIVKYDSSGNALWGYDPNDTLQNSLNNFGLAVTTDKDGCNFYFSGVTETPAKFGNTYINLTQSSELYVTKLDSGCTLITGVENQMQSTEMVKVYPNPFTNTTTILFNANGKHELEIEDMTGRILQQFECNGPQYELARGCLTDGMYFIKVTDANNTIYISKILVQ